MDVFGSDLRLSQTFYIQLALLVSLPVSIAPPIVLGWVEPSVHGWLGLCESPLMGLMGDEW